MYESVRESISMAIAANGLVGVYGETLVSFLVFQSSTNPIEYVISDFSDITFNVLIIYNYMYLKLCPMQDFKIFAISY